MAKCPNQYITVKEFLKRPNLADLNFKKVKWQPCIQIKNEEGISFIQLCGTLITIMISKQLLFIDVSLRIIDGSNLNDATIRQVLHYGQISSDIFTTKVDQNKSTRISLFNSSITKDVMSIVCVVEELCGTKENSLVLPKVGQITVNGCMAVEGVKLRLFQLGVSIQGGAVWINWEPWCSIDISES
jgi:hypothetical protein